MKDIKLYFEDLNLKLCKNFVDDLKFNILVLPVWFEFCLMCFRVNCKLRKKFLLVLVSDAQNSSLYIKALKRL